MVTAYNADLYIEGRRESCPEGIYEQTEQILRNAGLIGVKKVNHYGLVVDGYDKTCKIFRRGCMNIFYNQEIRESIPEMLENLESRLPLLSDESYGLANDTLELGKEMLKIASKYDPSSVVLPWGIYTSLPICPSLEINTPAGRQSVHYHTKDSMYFGVIQLYKPKLEQDWYDWDVFKNFLFDASLNRTLSIFDEGEKPNLLQRLLAKRRERSLKKAADLSLKVMINPDCIDRIPDFVKKMPKIKLW